jgi:glutaconate CoA-transferase subunit A
MAVICSLKEAVAEHVHDGDAIALEGFTHLIPHAAGHEVVRQGRRDLTLIRMTPDLIFDQLIGMGAARKLIFAWGGNPGVGSLYRLRDAVERGWPQPLALEEHSHAGMANAYVAGASNLPFALLRGYKATDLVKFNDRIKSVTCPFTGEELAAIPALRPDVGVIHAQRADKAGNVLVHGIVGLQKEVVLSARRSIVTVEEITDTLDPPANSYVLPHWAVDAVCVEPGGAYPSYALGCYPRDNDFYRRWDAIARDRDRFRAWMQQHVLGSDDHAAFLLSLGAAA